MQELEIQEATKGINTPPEVKTEILDLSERISSHEEELRRLQQITTRREQHSFDQQEQVSFSLQLGSSSNTDSADQIIIFKNSAELITAFLERVKVAKRVDDVTWGTESTKLERFSGQDVFAYHKYQDALTEVSQRDDVIWRELIVFSDRFRFEKEKERIYKPNAYGYNVKYFDPQPSTAPPRFGFAVVDAGEDNGEVFLSVTTFD